MQVRSWIAVAALLPGFGCATAEGFQPGPGTHVLDVPVAGAERRALLHLPPAIERGEPLPLVLAFHGGGGSAEGFRRYAGLDAVADREEFLVAYPDGTAGFLGRLRTWNAGSCCGRALREGADDVAFARAVVEAVARVTPVDRGRVYATGHSNGAMMSYRIGVEAPDLVAAIAPVAGAMQIEPVAANAPLPVLHIHSLDDPRALYDGGLGPPFPLTRHRVLHHAVEEELDRWVVANGCPDEPRVLDRRREDATGHTALHLRWSPCASGAPVELWQLTGAGHGWPGATTGRERLVGPATHVIDAAEEVWRFLSRFHR